MCTSLFKRSRFAKFLFIALPWVLPLILNFQCQYMETRDKVETWGRMRTQAPSAERASSLEQEPTTIHFTAHSRLLNLFRSIKIREVVP
jgi:hypothetical protein